jgi:hypothetical protein
LYYLLWGQHHYTGPIMMGSEDEMKRMESEAEKSSIYREPGVADSAPVAQPEPQRI